MNIISKLLLKDRIESHIINHKINMEIARSKASLTNLEIKEIVEKLQSIPTYYIGSGSYNQVRNRFLENNKIIREVLEILKKWNIH